ncbi:MAG: hypothetical protein HW380_1975 [Magnetococcales bacterium]|nr:hypothetical protein [Magnetococcales bacterium]
MKSSIILFLALFVVAIFAGCATVPSGPSTRVLPGSGMSFDRFRLDDDKCRHYAEDMVGNPDEAQVGLNTTILSTAVGVLAGAALGGRKGAAIGGGAGLLLGGALGADASQTTSRDAQRRYDDSYIQCMYASGHQVPVSGVVERTVERTVVRDVVPSQGVSSSEAKDPSSGTQAPRRETIPPPPPGYPPPPPPGSLSP